jgi:hypothetical protein
LDGITSIGVYCDNAIYSVLLNSSGPIKTEKNEKHEGRLRHFKFIKYLKSLDHIDLCVIVQNDESKPIINYLRREKKRSFLPIEFSPLTEQPNYKENPDLMTLARKLSFKRRQSDVIFPPQQSELKNQIKSLGEGDEAIHMRTLDGTVLAWMAAVHGIFILDE